MNDGPRELNAVYFYYLLYFYILHKDSAKTTEVSNTDRACVHVLVYE